MQPPPSRRLPSLFNRQSANACGLLPVFVPFTLPRHECAMRFSVGYVAEEKRESVAFPTLRQRSEYPRNSREKCNSAKGPSAVPVPERPPCSDPRVLHQRHLPHVCCAVQLRRHRHPKTLIYERSLALLSLAWACRPRCQRPRAVYISAALQPPSRRISRVASPAPLLPTWCKQLLVIPVPRRAQTEAAPLARACYSHRSRVLLTLPSSPGGKPAQPMHDSDAFRLVKSVSTSVRISTGQF